MLLSLPSRHTGSGPTTYHVEAGQRPTWALGPDGCTRSAALAVTFLFTALPIRVSTSRFLGDLKEVSFQLKPQILFSNPGLQLT